MGPVHPLRRKDDTARSRTAWSHESRQGRARTIFISVLCSGLVALGIVRVNDVLDTNADQAKFQQNCQSVRNILIASVSSAQRAVRENPDPAVKERQRAAIKLLSKGLPPAVATCEDLYPRKNILPWVE